MHDDLFFPLVLMIVAAVTCFTLVIILYGQKQRLLAEIADLKRRPFPMTTINAFGYGDLIWPGIAKVVEESGEVLQAIGKLMMVHGNHEAHWDGNLIDKIEEEVPDLDAALTVFKTLNYDKLDHNKMDRRALEKIDKFHDWQDEGVAAREAAAL